MAGLRIFIVDSERSTLQLADDILAKRGHELRTATDGQTALNMVTRWAPDLMLLDPHLPVMDGYQFVRLLRARPSDTILPIIFMATPREVRDRLPGFTMDVDDFMPKPLNPQELEIRVLAAMKRRQETERRLRPAPETENDEWTVRMSGMRGSLSLIGLPTVLTTLEMDRKTGVLVIALDELRTKARLELCRGKLVRASLDDRPAPANAELVYSLIPCVAGKFDFRPKAIDPADEIQTPISSLILEGARRADEKQRGGRRSF
jgi:DNA-binding response OmpR family regulator